MVEITADISRDDFILARAVAMRGFGGRRAGELLFLRPDGSMTGTLFGGAADEMVRKKSKEMLENSDHFGFLTVGIGDSEAVRAGMACGGEADVLLHQSYALPGNFVERLAKREPVSLATVVEGRNHGLTVSVSPTNSEVWFRDGVSDEELISKIVEFARKLLTRRAIASVVEEIEGQKVAIELFSPPPFLLIVGGSELADAILNQGRVLGWSGQVVHEPEDGIARAAKLGPNDALVVLSHDPSVAIPVMAQVLRTTSAYIGGLGSRHTQNDRSERLKRLGFSAEDLDRIYGPIGLDLGSKTPEETALAICAEILAHISGRTPSSLKHSSGPING